MTGADVTIRRLLPADAALYRAIRLEALRFAPEAFSSTFAAEHAEPISWFATRLESAAVFGAFVAGELSGIAGFFRKPGLKEAHKGMLVGMYVRPNARKRGIGGCLAEAIVEHARQEVEILQLSVVAGNERARRLYGKLGFIEYGIEKNALKQNGCYWDEVLMAKSLLTDQAARL